MKQNKKQGKRSSVLQTKVLSLQERRLSDSCTEDLSIIESKCLKLIEDVGIAYTQYSKLSKLIPTPKVQCCYRPNYIVYSFTTIWYNILSTSSKKHKLKISRQELCNVLSIHESIWVQVAKDYGASLERSNLYHFAISQYFDILRHPIHYIFDSRSQIREVASKVILQKKFLGGIYGYRDSSSSVRS